MRALLILTTTLLLLTGCSSDDDPVAGEAPTTEAVDAQPSEVTAPATAEPTAAATDPAADFAVVLEPGGLGLSDGAASITRLTFSDSEQGFVTSALLAVLGPPDSQETGLECGPGPLDSASWDGFDAYFLDGMFAGWYLQEPPPEPMTTADGIGLGATRAELEESFGEVTVEETTIGTEWNAGELSGILAGGADGTVDIMWSGATCIAR